ncbi:MAG: helicase-exonuclease AddAB subunit AddA [Oscillospiraceae bacterium]|nr:helicase-exonuclease AddAB subunit AddA [Oscillospiraceae bacterium]
MAFKATKQQQDAIDAKGTVLVSAAAGSGKTAVLVERVIKLLTRAVDPVDADKLLIVTFTNAAAAEMRTRIEKRLDEECDKNPKNRRLLRQQLMLQSAKICTIDSFCIELVRDNFYVLEVQPDFKIIDPGTANPLKLEIASDVITSNYANKDKIFLDLAASLNADYGDSFFVNTILRIYENSCCMPFPEKWLVDVANMYQNADLPDTNIWAQLAFSYAKDILSGAADELSTAIRDMSGNEIAETVCKDLFKQTSEQIVEALHSVDNCDWNKLYEFCWNFKMPAFGVKIKKMQDEALKDLLKSVRENVNMTIENLAKLFFEEWDTISSLQNASAKIVSKLADMVLEFSNVFKAELKNRNMLTFDMVEHLALSLLCRISDDGTVEPTEHANEICKSYYEVLVDEYQDTNNLQDALFYALSDGGKHLFMVGDVKQSIYGFRHANPENFLARKESYPPYNGEISPSKIILGANFRSRTEVCDYINFFFGRMMQKATGTLDYNDEEKLIPSAAFPENEVQAVETHFVDINDGEDSRAAQEGIYIAQYIKSVMEKEPFLRDKLNPTSLRKARYSDFTILLRSLSARAPDYVSELRKRGIPTVYDSGDFYETVEIMTVISLLKTIDNPTRDVPLLSCMSSVVFGFSFDEIATIRAKNKAATILASVTLAANSGNSGCKLFLDTLKEYRNMASTMPIGRLLSEIYKRTAIPEMMSVLEEGDRRRANLQSLQNYADEYEQYDNAGLSGFLRYLDRLYDSGNIKSGGVPSGNDAVRLMSIHASKGLQFPICIIAGISNKFNNSDSISSILISEKFGIGMKYTDSESDTKYNTLSRQAISIDSQRHNIAEELRLLYVAMTRAEEKLVMVVSHKNLEKVIKNRAAKLGSNTLSTGIVSPAEVLSAGSYSDWIITSSLLHPNAKELCEFANINPSPLIGEFGNIKIVIGKTETDCAETEQVDIKAEAETQIVQMISDRLSFQYKYKELCNISAKATVTEMLNEEDDASFRFMCRPECMSKSGLTPSERGTAAHRFMQFVDFENAKLGVQSEIDRLIEWEYLSEREAAALDVNALKQFFKSELCSRIEKSNMKKREQNFLCEMPAIPDKPNGEQIIVQGCVDCVFAEDDGLVVVDFKTSRLKTDQEFRDKYVKQLQIYSKAMSETYNLPIKEQIIYSLYLNKSISI